MSSEALPAAALAHSGEAQAYQRMLQIQSLIEQARQSAAGSLQVSSAAAAAPQAGATDFATALQSATNGVNQPGSAAGIYAPASYRAEANAAGAQPAEYEALVVSAAQRYGIDPALLHGLIQQESGFDANALSSAGAAGLTQLMPATAASLGVADPLNPAESIQGGARYLSQLLGQFGGNTTDALAAYNAGPGAVQQYGGVPPYAETQSYVSKVLGYAESYRQSQSQAAPRGALA